MEKVEFINKIAKMINTKQDLAEMAVNATLAEVLGPRIWQTPEDVVGFFDNNCNNNCKEDIGRLAANTKLPNR